MIDTSKIIGKVEYCLDKWVQARSRDSWLIAALIAVFYKKYVHDGADCIPGKKYVALEDIADGRLPNTESIRRCRCKFHEEGKYLPPEAVIEKRAEHEDYMRHEMVKSTSDIEL